MAEPIDRLVPDPRNARKHSKKNIAVIAASLRQHGQVQPIVVNSRNDQVVVGNGRLLAAKELGWEFIAVLRRDMTDIQQAALAIADNRSAELATWDAATLDGLLLEIDLTEPDLLDVLGLDDLLVDRSDAGTGREVEDKYEIIIECENEADQKKLYERLTAEGLRCRVLTI